MSSQIHTLATNCGAVFQAAMADDTGRSEASPADVHVEEEKADAANPVVDPEPAPAAAAPPSRSIAAPAALAATPFPGPPKASEADSDSGSEAEDSAQPTVTAKPNAQPPQPRPGAQNPGTHSLPSSVSMRKCVTLCVECFRHCALFLWLLKLRPAECRRVSGCLLFCSVLFCFCRGKTHVFAVCVAQSKLPDGCPMCFCTSCSRW